jgi:hypothetical protein
MGLMETGCGDMNLLKIVWQELVLFCSVKSFGAFGIDYSIICDDITFILGSDSP